MPIVGTSSSETIEAQYNTINELKQKCESCKLFNGKPADSVYVYTVLLGDYDTEDGPAMIAIARYGDTYAILPPKYLTGDQWSVLEYWLRDYVEPGDKLVFFSQETFANLGKCSHGKPLNVQLCV